MARFAQLTSFTRALGPWSAGDGTLQQRLERAVEAIIEREAWDLSHPLPPDRVLARTLGISRTTVIGAYESLASETSLPVLDSNDRRLATAGRQ